MDIYELLGEDPDAPGHKHARSLVAADHALVRDLVAVRAAMPRRWVRLSDTR